jgi:hypothetical protein
VEGGGGGLTVSGVSRNSGGFVKCVAIQKRLGIPALVTELPRLLHGTRVGSNQLPTALCKYSERSKTQNACFMEHDDC